MNKVLIAIDFALLIIMSAAYFYHIVYLVVGIFTRGMKPKHADAPLHRFAALICARNETAVIGELIDSLKKQNYPTELLDIYVLADNCTDDTAEVAEAAGAHVYRRCDTNHVGKGFALNFLLHKIDAEQGFEAFDGYFVFDADNLVDPNFVAEMNKTFSKGYDVITSYRNSKNFAYNWITYGYSVWFLFEARFINASRMLLGNGCAISGTGFMVASKIIRQNDGWPFHLLTEDIQFSVNCAISGCKIGYCDRAIVFDEQPETFAQSWTQRMRWAKGFYQIDARYLGKLAKGSLTCDGNKMTCYDILMTVAPCRLLSIAIAAVNVAAVAMCVTMPHAVASQVTSQASSFIGMTLLVGYIGAFFMGVLTIISEWKNIKAPAWRKIAYLPTFPVFLATYVPIALVALLKKDVGWKPIRHYASSQINASLAPSRNNP